MVASRFRRVSRPRTLFDPPRVDIDADGRVDRGQFEHWQRTVLEWSRAMHDDVEFRTPKTALFMATGFSVPTGVAGNTGITTLAEVDGLGSPELDYDVHAFGVTFNRAGVYAFDLMSSFASNATGTTRQVVLISNLAGIFLAPSSQPGSTFGNGMGVGGSTLYRIRRGETIGVQARQDSGVALNLDVRLSVTCYRLTPS